MHSYLTLDVTPEAMGSFFEATAELYERSPWRLFPSNGHLFQVTCSALGFRKWAGAVLGQGGESYGVLLFDSPAAFDRYVELGEMASRNAVMFPLAVPRHRAISFDPKRALPPSLRREIEQHQWRVARGDAYPSPMLIEPDMSLAPPAESDLRRLEAVARVLVQLIDAVPDLPQRWDGGEGLRKRFRVPVQGQEVSITISLVMEPEEELPGVEEDFPAEQRIPNALRQKVESLMAAIDPFCRDRLDGEYRQLCYAAVAALARKRPSPLLGGREASWCAGVVHAMGMVNFLFDRTQTPHCKATEIYAYFGVSDQTGQSHSKKVRDLLKIGQLDPQWTRPSRMDSNPVAWLVQVDGFLLDARRLPLEFQIEACALGLIPYVPALRAQGGNAED
ncbi:DUF6398 domain-containing protein [Synechococcus sp. CS-1328]|uniref:DUF6398 domain-containing protein n=1 Tax=Synechococcus sp. CS-1328 TaxID=2847976 RepID=UPI00223BF09F|nr:DUF6398 domain-containing protein [Synechococcus sp. CS-1328]MCT0226358.1 hypothetical protein [Synechococcus sp. CS-1328]